MPDRPTRHLAAVVFTDLVGYTALMQDDEAAALAARSRHRQALQDIVSRHDGRLIQFFGDGSLSLFPSSVSAVAAGLELQRALTADPPLPLRVGIDEGEVAYDDQGVYGHCVNVASRIERLASAGSVFVSEKVYREVENQPVFVGTYEGEHELKNVDRPVGVYSIRAASERAQPAQLHLLGGASLKFQGTPVSGRSAQRRRMAFLALLSSAPHGVISRDKIVGYLWPDTEPAKARRLLSEALYVVRKSLGEQAVIASGEELRLNPEVVWSDVGSFRAAIEAGDLEAAASLYAGPFLDGFYVDYAIEFERWSDGMRDRLARDHATALRRLAEASGDRKHWGEAVRWWRRLIELDPLDAAITVRYMEALESAGRRAEALQFARRHAELLEEEFGAEPNPEVEALARRLREAPAHADLTRRTAPPPVPGAFESVAAYAPPDVTGEALPRVDTEPPVPQPPVEERRRAWRRVLLPAAASVAAVLTAWAALGRDSGQTTSPGAEAWRPATVAVLPFDGDSVGLHAKLMNDYLADVRGVRSVPAVNLAARLADDPSRLHPDSVGEIVTSVGGTHVLRGTVLSGNDVLRLAIELSAPGGDTVLFRWSQEARPTDRFDITRDAAVALITYLTPPGTQPQIGRPSTASSDAIFAYLEGGQAFVEADFQRAVRLYERAIEADGGFVMAYYRLSQALQWDEQYVEAFDRAREAAERAATLPAHDRRLVEGWRLFLSGRPRAALDAYQDVLARWPNDVEALYGLAKTQMIYNPILGRSRQDAQPYLDALHEVAPAFGDGLLASMELAALRGEAERFDSLQALVSTSSAIAQTWALSEGLAEGDRSPAQTMAQIDDPVDLGFVSGQLAGYWGEPAVAALLVDRFLESAEARTNREMAAVAMLLAGVLEITQGRWELGDSDLETAAGASPGWATELLAFFACLPGRPAAAARQARAALEDWTPAVERDESLNPWLAQHNNRHPVLRRYLMGLTEICGGSPEAADEEIEYLDNIRSTQDAGDLADALAKSLKAHRADALGNSQEALHHLDNIDLAATLPQLIASPFYSRPHDRFLRAQIMERAGLFRADPGEDAIDWYMGLTEMWDFAYVAPAHLGLARSYAALGDTVAARTHYERAESYWRVGDAGALQQLAAVRADLGLSDSTAGNPQGDAGGGQE